MAMKKTWFISLMVISLVGRSQPTDTLFAWAKATFDESIDNQNFNQSITYLNTIIERQPENTEAWYWKGYCYDRLNATDGKGIPNQRLTLALNASRCMERVLDLEPQYTGDPYILYPHQKITSIWGSMALKYLAIDQIDSARWAFKEGRQRGGFSDFLLEKNRRTLQACSDTAYLFSAGDAHTFPLMYLQFMEGLKPQVTLVDLNLLNTTWYPSMLDKTNGPHFGLNPDELDEVNYTQWSETVIKIEGLTWRLKPTYMSEYLLRGDVLTLRLLKANAFEKEVYFVRPLSSKQQLYLNNEVTDLVYCMRLDHGKLPALAESVFLDQMYASWELLELVNTNDLDELVMVDHMRWLAIKTAEAYMNLGNKRKARKVLETMQSTIKQFQYPYQNPGIVKFLAGVEEQLK